MKTKIFTLCATLCCAYALFAGNVITYTASEKLDGIIAMRDDGFPYFSDVSTDVPSDISSHTFADGHGIITFDKEFTSINDGAFSGCNSLISITIPNSVTHIGEDAFYGCDNLTQVTLSNGLIQLFGVSNPILSLKEVILTDLTAIPESAFSGCTGLTSVTIPNSVTQIGYDAFADCTGLTSITIPNSVTSIGSYAFSGCTGLTSPVYNANCFAYMPTLYSGSYTIPDGIQQIACGAFANCTRLTSVTIPNSVTSIGSYAFSGCDSVTSVILPDNLDVSNAYLYFIKDGMRYQVLTGKEVAVANWYNSDSGEVAIPSSVTAGNTFSVTSIGSYAFAWWDSITSVTIPNSITSIGGSAFDGCTGLTSVTIPNSVTSIGWSAFDGCTGLTSVTIPDGVASIGSSAFSNCSALSEVTLLGDVTTIGVSVFAGCKKIYDIYCYATEPPSAFESSFANYNAYLHVPCESKKAYDLDAVFGSFKYIECLGASEEILVQDTVTVVPSTNNAVFTWPQNAEASSYTLVITKDSVTFCTLVFNASGQLTGIAFAPSKNGSSQMPAAIQTISGLQFTVTGLNSASKYGFNLEVKDASDQVIKHYEGEFATEGYVGPVTAVESVTFENFYTEQGRIICENVEDLRIYTVTGIDVTSENGHLQGVYIVKCGEQTTKVVVK